MVQRILVPIDGSRASLRACEYAADLAQRYRAAVTLLIVSDVPVLPDRATLAPLKAEMEQTVREANEQILDGAARVFTGPGLEVRKKQRSGYPAGVISREATEGNYDLVIMGSRGLGLRNDEAELVGSVTERVLRRVPCPVLIVKS
jgi:nucleotide-binding universal stress UspA family protein